MTKEKKIELLMLDRCTRQEAENLSREAEIFEEQDFRNFFDQYLGDMLVTDEEEIAAYRKMLEEKIPVDSYWSIVNDEENTYFIQYAF